MGLARQAELVLGSRMAGAQSEMPAVRRLDNRLCAGLVTAISGQRVSNGKPAAARRPSVELAPKIRPNLGARRIPPLRPAAFPAANATVQTLTSSTRPTGTVDILLVNPPTPDGGIWIRSQHRVGRRSRENMNWPQVSLAQHAALFLPE